ncbi:MAG: RNA 2',3'-cyclic phosphodiesterase [Desulforhopalus sp.]
MIRLFIAIDIPETIRREIQGMGRSIPNARPVPEDQLHLTLKFIGEVENSRLLDIHESLQGISHFQFSLCLRGVGTFPPRATPRVLWAGVDPPKSTIKLRNSIEKTLADIGIPRGKKKYTPHVTLARLRNSPIRQLQQFLAGNAFLQTADFPVKTFTLYSSKLTTKGAIHTVEDIYPLSPRKS